MRPKATLSFAFMRSPQLCFGAEGAPSLKGKTFFVPNYSPRNASYHLNIPVQMPSLIGLSRILIEMRAGMPSAGRVAPSAIEERGGTLPCVCRGAAPIRNGEDEGKNRSETPHKGVRGRECPVRYDEAGEG